MKSRSYYTLCEFDGQRWSPQFGDYDREVVDFELIDYVEQGKRKRDLRIITTSDQQSDIDAAVATLNRKPLTDDEKKRIGPGLQRTAQAILEDVDTIDDFPTHGERRLLAIIELTLDANRPSSLGRVSRDDETLVCERYFGGCKDTAKWLRSLLDY